MGFAVADTPPTDVSAYAGAQVSIANAIVGIYWLCR